MIEIKKPKHFHSREEAAESFREDLMSHPTKYEQQFFDFLHRQGYQFEFQKIVYTKTSFYIVDFYLNQYNIIVELDGEGHKERMKEDAQRTEVLKHLGYSRVVRFWNKEIRKKNYCKSVLKTIIWKKK